MVTARRPPHPFPIAAAAIAAFLWIVPATSATGDEDKAPPAKAAERAPSRPDGAYRLLLEPRFMRHDHGKPVKDAQKTDLVPGRVTQWGVETIPAAEFGKLGLTWEQFTRKATANASADFKRLASEFRTFKDEAGSTAFAVLETDDPTTASTIFAPEFLRHFEKSLGDRLYLAVPSRTTVFIFPRGTDAFRKLSEDIIARYFEATYPCSLELLELDKNGLRAVGTFLDG